MSKREIAALSCKILSLYAVVTSALTLSSVFFYLGLYISNSGGPGSPPIRATPSYLYQITTGFIPFLFQCALAIFLWLLADGLAIVMVSDNAVVTRVRIRQRDILQAGSILLGLWLLTQSLSSLARCAVDYFTVTLSPATRFVPSPLGQAIGSAIQLALSVCLIAGARSVARVLARNTDA
jgi:hypothetical protein